MDDLNLVDRGCCNGHGGTCSKLNVYDWLDDVINIANPTDLVEVRFKNTRKDFFRNVNNLKLDPGDIVAVEGNPGHDIGIVTVTGDLVLDQMKKHKVTLVNGEIRKIYRTAKPADIEKWKEAIACEQQTMIRARQIANELNLNMKIGDVEYQGDKTKAIFYYIADDRVDFRDLIKLYAKEFAIKIEMKQIGVRQEAGRIGGIASCGRALCCSTWRTDFSSVTSDAAIKQGLSPNAEKMTGHCGKLKCCLTYELDQYLEAQEDFPNELLSIETDKGVARHFKTEILQKKISYKLDRPDGRIFILDLEDVKKFLNMNKRGEKPSIESFTEPDQKEGNMMNVGNLDQSFFTKPEPARIRTKRFGRPQQGNRNQLNQVKKV